MQLSTSSLSRWICCPVQVHRVAHGQWTSANHKQPLWARTLQVWAWSGGPRAEGKTCLTDGILHPLIEKLLDRWDGNSMLFRWLSILKAIMCWCIVCCSSSGYESHFCLLLFLPYKGFASKLSQPQDSEEEEKEGELQGIAFHEENEWTRIQVPNVSSNLNLFFLKASKTVESATGQAMETEAAE